MVKDLFLVYIGVIIGIVSTLFIKGCKGDDEESTRELRKMCQNCEKYCGEQHDFEECKDLICFKFWLAYKYLEWSNGYGG